jgi:glycosyltransferase involved in cell wall biosynthesis
MPRRVLYLMPNATPGGAERATMLMLSSHDRARYEPAVLFFTDGPLVDDARRLGIEVHVLRHPVHLRQPASVVRTLAQGRRLVAEGGFALVHSCMAYAQLFGGAIATAAGVSAVLYQHGPLGAWMDGAATLLRCDRILANSAFTASEQQRRSWRARPVTIAPYGIDITRPDARERERLRALVDQRHDLSPESPVIGMMARFDPWKGIDVTIRAAAPLLRERPALRLVIVGGQYRHFHPEHGPVLRQLVEREGVATQVIFAGHQADVRPYLARMTVLVHASRQPEPFGLTLVEAMAAGVPVIAARAGGAVEIVEEGVDGLLHTAGDERDLRDQMRSLLDDPARRESFVAAGLRKVESKYRPAHMMRVIEGVYDELLGAPSRASVNARAVVGRS